MLMDDSHICYIINAYAMPTLIEQRRKWFLYREKVFATVTWKTKSLEIA
jgi:hypothetical protein